MLYDSKIIFQTEKHVGHLTRSLFFLREKDYKEIGMRQRGNRKRLIVGTWDWFGTEPQ